MNHMISEGNCHPCAPLPYTPFHQQSSHDQCFWLFQGGPNRFLSAWTQSLPSMATTTIHTPQHEASSLQYYSEVLHCLQPHCMPQMPGDLVIPCGSQKKSFMEKASEQTPQRPLGYCGQMSDGKQKNGTAGDLTACQLRNPSSSLPQGVVGASAHSSHKPTEDALQKRELRLMKNREAARECRRKKKEYVKCLENRVAVLENQNKTLIEELRALKDIYRHKVE